MPSDQRNLFQIDEHLPRSLVFLSIMDSAADIDLSKTRLSKSISSSDDYENGSLARLLLHRRLYAPYRSTTSRRVRSMSPRTQSRAADVHHSSPEADRRETVRRESKSRTTSAPHTLNARPLFV